MRSNYFPYQFNQILKPNENNDLSQRKSLEKFTARPENKYPTWKSVNLTLFRVIYTEPSIVKRHLEHFESPSSSTDCRKRQAYMARRGQKYEIVN